MQGQSGGSGEGGRASSCSTSTPGLFWRGARRALAAARGGAVRRARCAGGGAGGAQRALGDAADAGEPHLGRAGQPRKDVLGVLGSVLERAGASWLLEERAGSHRARDSVPHQLPRASCRAAGPIIIAKGGKRAKSFTLRRLSRRVFTVPWPASLLCRRLCRRSSACRWPVRCGAAHRTAPARQDHPAERMVKPA